MKTVCIVDDQPVALKALRLILKASDSIDLIGSFTSAEAFVNEYETLLPDVTIMDLDLPGMSGIDAISMIKSIYPSAKFLVLTNFDDDERLFKSLKAGADGYLLKRDSLEGIAASVDALYDGGSPMTREIARKVIHYFQRPTEITKFHILTEKEAVVLQLLVDGLLYKEIADSMGVTIDTIKKHTQNIYQKLQVRTRSEAIKLYLKN
jgi:two-component system, NarL family, response regulator LiaR